MLSCSKAIYQNGYIINKYCYKTFKLLVFLFNFSTVNRHIWPLIPSVLQPNVNELLVGNALCEYCCAPPFTHFETCPRVRSQKRRKSNIDDVVFKNKPSTILAIFGDSMKSNLLGDTQTRRERSERSKVMYDWYLHNVNLICCNYNSYFYETNANFSFSL